MYVYMYIYIYTHTYTYTLSPAEAEAIARESAERLFEAERLFGAPPRIIIIIMTI